MQAQAIYDAKFSAVRNTHAALIKSEKVEDHKAFVTALQDALNTSFYTTFQNLMDDSGVSDQPFFIEGDGFLLNLFANAQFDVNVQGSTLSFIYLLEQHVASLTEGERKVEFIFFETFGKVYQKSSYLWLLRSIAIAYLKHTLNIKVNEYVTISDDVLLPLYNDNAPLFTLLSDAKLNDFQQARIAKLYNFTQDVSKKDLDVFPLEQLQVKLLSFTFYLLQHDKRTARLEEVSSLEGMLQALLYQFQGDPDNTDLKVPIVLPKALEEKFYPTPKNFAAGNSVSSYDMVNTFSITSTALAEAGIKSDRLAVLITALEVFFSQCNKLITPDFAIYITLAAFTTLLSDKLPVKARPQPIIGEQKLSKALQTVLDKNQSIYSLFNAIAFFAMGLGKANVNAISALAAGSLFDILDGALLKSLFAQTHVDVVVEQLKSTEFITLMKVLITKIPGMSKYENIAIQTADFVKTNAVIIEEQDAKVTAELSTNVPKFITTTSDNNNAETSSSSSVTTPAALLAIQWKDLPQIDSQIFKVLLYALGDNGLIYNQLKDNQQLDPSKAVAPIKNDEDNNTTTKTTPAEPEVQEEMDDWDADEPEQEEMDDWDAEDDSADPADDWDAESTTGGGDDNANVETTQQQQQQETNIVVPTKPVHKKLLGGELSTEPIQTEFWDTCQLVGDGSTMPAAEKEALFRHNPISINRDTKYALRKLIIEYQDRSKPIPYVMPPDEKIKTRCEGVYGLNLEKAKQWIAITIANLTIKLENSRVTKANSTKKEYNQSMITPSRVVLRDIVATAEDGAYPSAPPAASKSDDKNTKDNNNNNKKASQNNKKGPQKENVQDKVARELAEKQQKADMDKILSTVNTLKNAALSKRINELDKKLLAHGDLPSALHGNMVLLDWRLQQWKLQVDNKAQQQALSKTATTLSSTDAANEAHMEIAVRLVQLLFDLSRRFLHIMSAQQIEAIQQAYALLGFFDSEVEVGLRWKNATGQAKYTAAQINTLVQEALQKSKSTAERRYAVGTTRSRFLLQHAGHILLRNVNSSSDPRVNGFYPDEWQRKLLDIVDRNESALVVAPTSAGKTLVSFYAVSRVLKQNKELTDSKVHNAAAKKGVVVFVAPTFPLARQMESDIANRNKDAEVVVHDTNIKLKSMKFDVLITLPQCLENLLTSPSRSEWAHRIKYIVFDEVHSIGSTLNGPIWERLFLLAHQVPFLALSATVGGVKHFEQWLLSMRQKYLEAESGPIKGAPIIADTALITASQPAPQVSYIQTDVRWSHLHHYFYIPPTAFFEEAFADMVKSGNQTVAAVQPPPHCDGFVSLHPVATLALNNSTTLMDEKDKKTIVATQANDDMQKQMSNINKSALQGLFNIEFSTSDCLQLYDTIDSVLAKSPRFAAEIMDNKNSPVQTTENANKLTIIQQELQRLNPDKYFNFYVEKIHTLEYATELKTLLLKMYDAVLDTEILEIISVLSEGIRNILKPLTMATHARRDLWKRQFLPLLRSLQQRDWFPAIIFCLDRSLCTELAYHVVAELEKQEFETWTAEKDKRLDKSLKDKEYEAKMKQAKRLRDLQNQKKRGSAEASKELEEDIRMGLVDAAMLDPDYFRTLKPYNPEDWNADPPDERFSFVKETEWMADDVRTYWERRVKRKSSKDDQMNGTHPLVKALYRGFGVHHYGVEKQYRDLVEILFRQRNLKFVISIETLGLGVNMPCRTAVFAFTTVALNPLNYRQMSGRAGRRGFDDKGQVIFFGIDPHHACRLMTSSLTPLRGHFNLSCSTILRLCIKFFFAKENQQQLNNIVNTTIVGQKTKIGTTNNLALLDHITFLTRSFFTYSESYPLHVRVQLLHYFRYCMTYFQRMALFSDNGAPSGLSYLLSATATATATSTGSSAKTPAYINDAGAFALVYLMRNGYIDELCSTYTTNKEEAGEKLMALLCHLFFPLRLRNNTTKTTYPAQKPVYTQQDATLKPGHLILPPIAECVSPKIADALNQHDTLVLQLFSRYALAVASTTTAIAQSDIDNTSKSYFTPTTMMKPEEMIALKKETVDVITYSQSLPVSQKTTTTATTNDDNTLVQTFQSTAVQSALRSPFNTLSTTQGDVFETPYDLITSISKHIDLRQSQIPVNIDRHSPEDIKFSSYAFDFYLNGCYDDVINCHGINLAEAWETLNRFTKLLQTLKKAVAILSSNQEEDNDDDFDAGDDDDGENAETEENTMDILKKSPLYANNSYVKEHLYVKGDMAKKHKITAECFNFVFKRFYKFFTSIAREKASA